MKYRELWKNLWRPLGHYDGNENWVAPVSFPEARELSQTMLEVFQELDNFLEQMKKQLAARSGNSAGAK